MTAVLRDFYENTARYRRDTWATACFPARIALGLLVATISRRVQHDGRVLFTGFYMTQRIPRSDLPCVKDVFPMPDGSATVVLRPVNDGTGFRLTSVPAS